jgi:GNAT superfamily N-acetyltransferase
MVYELAEFEKAPDECHLTEEQLHAALFGPSPALFGHVAFDEAGEPVGMMLWFLNFSTWEGQHGIYLEDLYVRPHARGTGLGKRLLATLAQLCVDSGYPRLQWWVLDCKDLDPSRAFYRRIGGTEDREWVPWRMTGEALHSLAEARV